PGLKVMKWILPLIAGAIVCFQVSGRAAEQSNTDSKQSEPRPRRGPFGAGAMGGGPGIERVFSVLTDEQRASLREAMEGQFEKVRGLEEKLREARRALLEAALVEKFDETAVREKAEAAAKLEAEVTVIRAKAFS